MVTSSCLAWVTIFLVFRFVLAGWGGTDDDDTRLTLPCQTGDEVTWVPFVLASVIYHLGHTVTSGHYVALLFHDGVTYVKGDHEQARRATTKDIACAECNAYLALWCLLGTTAVTLRQRPTWSPPSAAGSNENVAAAA